MAKELAKQYDPKGTEDRIYQEWCDKGYFHTQIDRTAVPPKLPAVLYMFYIKVSHLTAR